MQERQQILETVKQNYDDVVSKHSSDIGITHLQEMRKENDQELLAAASKPYILPLKHHIFVNEEIETLLEARLIEWSMSPYATPVIAVPR